MSEKTVKITFEVDGIQTTVGSVDELQDALKGVDKQAKKTESSVEKVGDAAKDMGKNAEDAGKASEGALKVIDEATGGLGTKVKEVGGGLLDMGKKAVSAFKGAVQGAGAMGKALIATGIGAIVVALGLIVAYWDDIKGFVSGVSAEQKDILAATEATRDAAADQLSTTESTEASLKLAGKSEREIRDLKIQQTNEVILATEAILEQQRQQKKAQIEAAERNQKITAGIIGFLTAPVTILLGAVDALTLGLKKIGVLEEATNLAKKFTMGTAKLLFDPEEVATEADATIAETEKQLNALKNKRDGFILKNKEEEKKARDDKKAADEAAAKEAADAEIQRAQELADLKKSIREAEANNEAEQRAKALEDLDLYYQDLIEKARQQGIDTTELEASRLEAVNALKQKYADEDTAREDAAKAKAKERSDYEKQLAKDVEAAKADLALGALDVIGQAAGEGSSLQKAAAVAATTVQTYQAAQTAYASQLIPGDPTSPIRATIAASVAVASGLLNVKKILSTPTPDGGSDASGGTPSAPSYPTPPIYDPTAALVTSTEGQDQNNVMTLGQQTGSANASIVKAYVVSDDMTSQQEADKKINDLARL